jgi:hypothetical protein
MPPILNFVNCEFLNIAAIFNLKYAPILKTAADFWISNTLHFLIFKYYREF